MYEGRVEDRRHSLAAVRLSLEGDASFGTYAEALAKSPDRRSSDTKLFPRRVCSMPVRVPDPVGSIPVLLPSAIRTVRLARHHGLALLPPDGAIRAFEYEGGDPGIYGSIPEWYQAAWTFVKMGFRHILDGADHLLFLFCLVIPFRNFRGLIPVVTAFTVAHSITLIASAYDMAPGMPWFPPLIETLIAASIVYMALENIVVINPKRRWLITFGFGLVHGFGFSFALRRTLNLRDRTY